MIEKLCKLGLEGNFLSLIKDIYRHTTTTIVLNGERLNAFPLRSRVRWIFIQHYSGVNSQNNKKDKDIKGIQIRKEVKRSLFAHNINLHLENPQETTKSSRTNG